MKLKIRYNAPRILMGRYRGKVLYPFVLFKDKRDEVKETTKRHELEHVYQIRRKGFIRWHLSYFAEWLKKGYYDNKYEVEARRAESQPLTEKEKQLFFQGKDSKFWNVVGVLAIVAAVIVISRGYLA